MGIMSENTGAKFIFNSSTTIFTWLKNQEIFLIFSEFFFNRWKYQNLSAEKRIKLHTYDRQGFSFHENVLYAKIVVYI